MDGLLDSSLGFGGEERAGASFLRLDGGVWTTDKDGIIPVLLAAEITARIDRDPGEIHQEVTREFGGVKVFTESGWFAARPSGTEDNYKICADSFQGADHLHHILKEWQTIVDAVLAVEPKRNQRRASPAVHQQTASEAKMDWRNEGNPN